MAKINKAMTLFLLLASDETFEAFMKWLREKGLKYWANLYSLIREKWVKKADKRGVVEIPLDAVTPQVLRALTCFSEQACTCAVDNLEDGDLGALFGHVLASRKPIHSIVALGPNWGKFTSKTFLEGRPCFDLMASKEEVFYQNPNLPVGVLALLIEGLFIAMDAVKKNKSILRELTDRGRVLKVGFLVTTHQKGGKQWLKVAAMVPLSLQNLEAVKDIAADLLETFPWLRLDASINVSIRKADPNGCVQKNHTEGQQAVAQLEAETEGGSNFAKNFLDPKTQKAGSWRFPVDSLPEAPIVLEKDAKVEFEAAVAARNPPVVVQTQPAPVKEPVVSLPKCLQVSWVDDNEDVDFIDYSVLPVMPTLPSRQEPVTPAKEESEAPTPSAPKKKNRRGTRGKGRA